MSNLVRPAGLNAAEEAAAIAAGRRGRITDRAEQDATIRQHRHCARIGEVDVLPSAAEMDADVGARPVVDRRHWCLGQQRCAGAGCAEATGIKFVIEADFELGNALLELRIEIRRRRAAGQIRCCRQRAAEMLGPQSEIEEVVFRVEKEVIGQRPLDADTTGPSRNDLAGAGVEREWRLRGAKGSTRA